MQDNYTNKCLVVEPGPLCKFAALQFLHQLPAFVRREIMRVRSDAPANVGQTGKADFRGITTTGYFLPAWASKSFHFSRSARRTGHHNVGYCPFAYRSAHSLGTALMDTSDVRSSRNLPFTIEIPVIYYYFCLFCIVHGALSRPYLALSCPLAADSKGAGQIHASTYANDLLCFVPELPNPAMTSDFQVVLIREICPNKSRCHGDKFGNLCLILLIFCVVI